jgi:hypothetical protein
MNPSITDKIARGQPLTNEEKSELLGFINKAEAATAQVGTIFKNGPIINEVSQVSNNLGRMYSGAFISGSGHDPDEENTDFTGSAMMYPGVTIGKDTYNVFGMKVGKFQCGMSSTTGKQTAAGGALTLDSRGITLNGAAVLANAVNGDNKYFVGGFSVLNSSGDDQMRFGILDAKTSDPDLFTNGDFGSGDFTGWSTTGSPSIVEDSPDGTYSAKTSASDHIDQSISSTDGNYYLLTFFCKSDSGADPRVWVDTWMYLRCTLGTPPESWTMVVALIKAPGATIPIKLTSSSGYSYFTNFSIYEVTQGWSYVGDKDTDIVGQLEIKTSKNMYVGSAAAIDDQPILRFDNPIQVVEQDSGPVGGGRVGGAFYAKTDHKPYYMDTDGNEIELGKPVREILTASNDFYIRPDGSDEHDGSANDSGHAWLTYQHAVDTLCSYDLSTYAPTVHVADGTYPEAVVLKSYLGAGPITIIGNETTPANVLLNTGTSITMDNVYGTWSLRGMKLAGSTYGFNIRGVSVVKFQHIDFASTGYHIVGRGPVTIQVDGNYTISSSAPAHWYASLGAKLLMSGVTLTLVGTPAFSAAFAYAADCSTILCNAMTFSGSATGVRYSANTNSSIFTAGGGPTYLPGNALGVTDGYGCYT